VALRSPTGARLALGLLFASAALTGLPATIAPHAFYEHFPFLSHWVDLLPPYNRHLVTDVGGLYLGFAVVFAWALWSLEVSLVRAACAGWLLMEILHLAFHASHLEGFGTADGIAQIASLALLAITPLVAIWAVGDGSRS
jgi:hypothetical protein